jgi:hypothetical protein
VQKTEVIEFPLVERPHTSFWGLQRANKLLLTLADGYGAFVASTIVTVAYPFEPHCAVKPVSEVIPYVTAGGVSSPLPVLRLQAGPVEVL